MLKKNIIVLIGLAITLVQINCSSSKEDVEDNGSNPNPSGPVTSDIDFWLSKPDQSVLLSKRSNILAFGNTTNTFPSIEVNKNQTFQNIDGFGFSLTGGSADAINSLSAGARTTLLQELYGNSANDISISYIRLSIGASDLNEAPFTYDDMPEGETDDMLSNFSLEPDMEGVIPVLKDILKINPDIKILGSPWSAPIWMKDNNSFVGGSLQHQYFGVYAQYFVKYIQAMAAEGITIDAITIQNEPYHAGNNPSMFMTPEDQAEFIKDHLGPAFANANIDTKIIIWDHNCDNPGYPISVLNNSEAKQYIDGSAFHLYGGGIEALTTVHNAHPDKNIYFTEQYTSSSGSFDGDLQWHVKNVVIGSIRNWSKNALEWNLASDENFQPHTDGGCSICKGGITISSSGIITRNVGYYIIAHASKFVPSGSVRIASTIPGTLHNVAFKTPERKIVLIVENDGASIQTFNIKYNGEWASATLGIGSVGTFVWEE
ncbi:glycoside hydrolase family 30 protein [Abyssalbus ytuae]|uniref:Glucosylceramidase n=1 Tax=Abyssalbus ytuae TaxID=2926907 RepID=A0A9E6ZJC7_9FLAO|nr:glycoside hydrolase family 30 beta sandwich domain-containing protein [Abyssalbus ytuae]UOB16634.1 glucosylceramidase [Abyssalbus ytuae]